MRFNTNQPIILTITMVVVLFSNSIRGEVVDPLDDSFYCQLTEGMNRLMGIIREGRDHLDRSAIDPGEKLYQLGLDANEIIEFVKISIAFEQYPGALRGPTGTLLSRSGNALDQSLLLGKFFRDAGYEARIARARLDGETAAVLLTQMMSPNRNRFSGEIGEELASTLAKLAGPQITGAELISQMQATENPKTDPDYKNVVETAEFLRAALEDTSIELAVERESNPLIKEAADYFWVQYRDRMVDGWKDVHPAFVDDPPDTMPEPSEFITEAVPEDLLHRIQIQFFVERSAGGELEAIPISEIWDRPVANLVTVPLSFSVIPTNMTINSLLEEGLSDAMEEAAAFAPVFNGQVMPDGKFFDLKGNVIDPFAASSPAAGVITTVGDRFGSAVEALGGNAPKLTGHWIQITLTAPDGSEKTYRRTTLDRIGPAARARGRAPDDLTAATSEDGLALLNKHTMMVVAGRTPPSLVVDRLFDWMLRAEPMYRQLREQVAYRAYDSLDVPELKPVDDLPTHWPGHLSLFSVFDRASALTNSHLIYRDSPGIVIHVQGRKDANTNFEMVDIVTNSRRAVTTTEDLPRVDPQAAMVAGVWDTAKEGLLLRPGDTRMNTDTVFEYAKAQGQRLVTLLPNKPVSGVTLSPDIQALVEADLSRGFALVLPDGQDLVEEAAWWRVHPETGETVGQLQDGRGAESVEALTMFGGAVTTVALLYGLDQCHQDYQRCNSLKRPIKECSEEYWCCNGFGFVTTIFGLFLSAVYSIAFDFTTTVSPSPCDF